MKKHNKRGAIRAPLSFPTLPSSRNGHCKHFHVALPVDPYPRKLTTGEATLDQTEIALDLIGYTYDSLAASVGKLAIDIG